MVKHLKKLQFRESKVIFRFIQFELKEWKVKKKNSKQFKDVFYVILFTLLNIS